MAQGRDATKTMLKDNPELTEEITGLIHQANISTAAFIIYKEHIVKRRKATIQLAFFALFISKPQSVQYTATSLHIIIP